MIRSPTVRRRLNVVGLLASLVVLAASAVSLLDAVRLVEVVALTGSAYAAGATTVALFRRR